MKLLTKDLAHAYLDWAVAKAEGYIKDGSSWLFEATLGEVDNGSFRPSINWSQAGPIIEREKMTLQYIPDDMSSHEWEAQMWDNIGEEMATGFGSTPLIAAMRCYLISHFGEEIEVPDEIC